MNEKPKFMMIYCCIICDMDSGYTELDAPFYRYCQEPTKMTLISKEDPKKEN